MKGKPILKVISAAKQAYTPQCGNCGNLLSHFFDKIFAKATFVLSKVRKSERVDFTKFFLVRVNFSFFYTVVLKQYILRQKCVLG